MATFSVWANQEMTIPLTGIEQTTIINENNVLRGVFYFGSPQSGVKLQTEINAGVDNVSLFPKIRLSGIERNTEYQLLNCNDYIVSGWVYRLIQAGTTASNQPQYTQSIGSTITDGSARFQCVSKCHPITEIKLALSELLLNSAIAGTGVQLGNTINGGSAIAIHYEITDTFTQVFSTFTCPQLCIAINDCVESDI